MSSKLVRQLAREGRDKLTGRHGDRPTESTIEVDVGCIYGNHDDQDDQKLLLLLLLSTQR